MERVVGNVSEAQLEAFKDKLTNQEVDNLLASFCNSESKAITLLAMGDDGIYTANDIHRRINGIQGRVPGWKMGPRTAFGYCQWSLAPIGLVAMEAANPNGTVFGYTKTEYGKKTGDALAGHILDFSEKHPGVGLRQIFGSTNSKAKDIEMETQEGETEYRKRSPSTRLKIFWILTTSDLPMRATDLLMQMEGIKQKNLASHFKELGRDGIITYDSKDTDKSYVAYKMVDSPPSGDPPPYVKSRKGALKSLTEEVWGIVKTFDSWFSINELAECYHQKHQGKKERKKEVEIVSVLKHIFENGYLERGKFSGFSSSEISLTTGQRNMLVDLLSLVDSFQTDSPGFRQAGIELGKKIVSDETIVSALMAKVKEKSPDANKRSRAETYKILYQIVSQTPEITSEGLCKTLSTDYNIRLRRGTVAHYLSQMEKDHLIRRSHEKNAIYWTTIQKIK